MRSLPDFLSKVIYEHGSKAVTAGELATLISNTMLSLEKVGHLGYTNRHAIETEAAFAPLKADNRFTAILKQISE